MGAKRILLEKGQDPLKMEFAEPRPNPFRGCIIGFVIMFAGICCVGSALMASGAFQ